MTYHLPGCCTTDVVPSWVTGSAQRVHPCILRAVTSIPSDFTNAGPRAGHMKASRIAVSSAASRSRGRPRRHASAEVRPSAHLGSARAYVINANERFRPRPITLPMMLGTVVFLLTFFVSRIQLGPGREPVDIGIPRVAIAVLLFLGAVVILEGGWSPKSVGTLAVIVFLSLTVNALYLFAYESPPLLSYSHFASALGTSFLLLTSIFVYAFLMYDERTLLMLFRYFAMGALVIGISAFVMNKANGQPYLISYTRSGSTRIQAMLSEPSAFAPVVAAGILFGTRQKDWVWLALSIVGLVLTRSPIVYATAILTVLIYVAIRRTRGLRGAVSVVVSTVSLLTIFNYLQRIPYQSFTQDANPVKQAVGRLSSGIVNVTSGGRLGENVRFAGAQTVVDDLFSNGWFYTGYGLNSSAVYFPAVYGEVRDFSLPLNMLFSFGVFGLLFFIGILVWALARTARDDYFLVFLPFAVASSINSAQGFATYQFVFLGIATAILRPAHSSADGTVEGEGPLTNPGPRGRRQSGSDVKAEQSLQRSGTARSSREALQAAPNRARHVSAPSRPD